MVVRTEANQVGTSEMGRKNEVAIVHERKGSWISVLSSRIGEHFQKTAVWV